MREEIFLEVIDEADCLVKQFAVGTTIHQDGLSAKHLRHFGQYGSTALCYEPITQATEQRVSGDTAESVTATALQTYTQFAQWHFDALVLLCLGE